MAKAQSGFVGDSGVQAHSAGDDFPITHYCVGGIPKGDGRCYWVIQHPCGTKRRSWTREKRDEAIASFRFADFAIRGLDCRVVSERTAFELALDSLQRKGRWIGFSLSSKGE